MSKKNTLANLFFENPSYFYALNQRIEIWQRAAFM